MEGDGDDDVGGGTLMVPWSSKRAKPDGVESSWGRGEGVVGDRDERGG